MSRNVLSVIDNNIRFSTRGFTAREFMQLRRGNLKVTDMAWITLKPKWDILLKEWYVPKTVILIFLN